MRSLAKIASPFSKEILALHYHIGEEETKLWGVHLKRKGDELILLETALATSIEELIDGKAALPTVLLITGRGVLSKKITASGSLSPEQLLQKAFPRVNPDDLFHEITRLGSFERVAISVLRRKKLDEILDHFPDSSKVVDVHLGEYSIWPLVQGLEGGEVALGPYYFNIRDTEVTPLAPLQENISLLGEDIPSAMAMAFLAGVRKLSSGTFHSQAPRILKNQESWKYGFLYQRLLLGGLATVFLVLLFSFIGYSYYSDKLSSLGLSAETLQQQTQQLKMLQEQLKQKEQFLAINGSTAVKASRLGDQIGATVPKGISLSRLNLYPVEKRLKRENLVRFSNNQLLIQGETRGYKNFQSWMGKLRQLEWVKAIEILGYEEVPREPKATFNIKLVLAK